MVAIDGKPLTIVADGGVVNIGNVLASSAERFGLQVSNLAAGDAVNLAGLRLLNGGFLGGDALDVDDCAGQVLLRDCVLEAATRSNSARVTGSSAVTLVDCDVDATAALAVCAFDCGPPMDEATALVSEESDVYLFGSAVTSGRGQEGDVLDPSDNDGFRGPAGWKLTGGFGLAVRSDLTGGEGGLGAGDIGGGCGDGGAGGPGVELVPGASDPALVVSDVTLTGGSGGAGGGSVSGPSCLPGTDGPEQLAPVGSIGVDPASPRELHTESLVREGELKTEVFVGRPGDLVWHVLGVRPATSLVFVPELTGAWILESPYLIRFRGMVPAAGRIDFGVVVPQQGPTVTVLYEQAAFFDGLRFHTSNPQVSVVLDDAF